MHFAVIDTLKTERKGDFSTVKIKQHKFVEVFHIVLTDKKHMSKR